MPGAAISLAEEVQESTFDVPVAALKAISGMREHGLDEDHVTRLTESEGAWPAVLIWDGRRLVLDGAHRLAAAKRLGMATIRATSFAGSRQEAYAEAVRRNIAHGLPLTLKERVTAAGRILASNREWSDRRISLACGLSAKTVARVRRDSASRGAPTASALRIGRDGRIRPLEPGAVRERIAAALSDNPGGSLREIAARAGASPETVRLVRRSLERPEECAASESQVPAPPLLSLLTSVEDRPDWSRDKALSSIPLSEAFVKWFEGTDVDGQWTGFVSVVPLSRVYEVADEARRRAKVWRDFADALEGRVRRRHG